MKRKENGSKSKGIPEELAISHFDGGAWPSPPLVSADQVWDSLPFLIDAVPGPVEKPGSLGNS